MQIEADSNVPRLLLESILRFLHLERIFLMQKVKIGMKNSKFKEFGKILVGGSL